MSVSASLASLAFCLWVVPPAALTASFVRREGDLWKDDYLAVAATSGYGVILTGSGALAVGGWLTPIAFWIGGLLVAIVSFGGLALKHRYLPARAISWREAGMVALPIAVAVMASLPVLATVLDRPDALPGSTPWYYWDLARQTADISRFPDTSIEWGEEVPFLRDYPAFTAATAGLALSSSRPDLLFAAHIFRIASAVGAALGIWYLSRVWGANRYGATTSAFLLLTMVVFSAKLMSYRPESAGYLMMLATPALASRWLREERKVFLFAASFGLATLAITHGISWTMSAILLIATVLAWILYGQDAARERFAKVGVLLVSVLVAWFALALILQSDPTGAGHLASLPASEAGFEDPTWAFNSALRGETTTDPPAFTEIAQFTLTRGFQGLPWWVFWSVAIVGAGIVVVRAVRGDPTNREFLTTILFGILGVSILCIFFAVGWDTYVPRRTGILRIGQIALVMVPLLLGVACGASRRRWPVLAIWITALSLATWATGASTIFETAHFQSPEARSLAQLRSLSVSGEVLANAYTEGFIATSLRAHGTNEGRAPYSDPPLLLHAIEQLTSARLFFADPSTSKLDIAEYELVLVSRVPWALGTGRVFPADLASLMAHPDLRLVEENPSWIAFEILN